MVGLESITEAVARALSGECEVADGTPVVAACSGGADSVALVYALAALGDRFPLSLVIFVDHGLRDVSAEASAAERAAVAARVPFCATRVTLDPTRNLQEEARRQRYRALEERAPAGAVIATGHTMTDQAETVLARIVRGTGLPGLAAIRPREGRVVRPMLAIRRATTRATRLDFVDDPSNTTPRFLRNRLRGGVMPALEAENPAVDAALAALARAALAQAEIIDALRPVLAEVPVDHRGLPPRIAETLVRWRTEEMTPRPSRAALQQLAKQLVAGVSASTSLGGGRRGVTRGGRLTLELERDPRQEVVAAGPGTYRLGTLALDLTWCAALDGVEDSLPAGLIALCPREKVLWPITLRRQTARSLARPPSVGRPHVTEAPGAPQGGGKTWPMTQFVITDGHGQRLWPLPIGGAHRPRPSDGPWLCARPQKL